MRRCLLVALAALTGLSQVAHAQLPPQPAQGKEKENANPCREEVAQALQKLRKSSWFRMTTSMITENGPTSMQVDYVLPDKMHQKVSVPATQQTSEMILVGEQGWSKNNTEPWKALPHEIVQDLKTQLYQTVIEQQTDVGNYSCKGRTQFDGKEVLSYKLEDEPSKDSTAPRNEAFRMFYVDAVTGLPVSNALIVPGRETKPLFKASYAFPVDITIEAPKDVAAE